MSTPSMGWKTFASVLILIGGVFNVIDGLVAIIRANYFSRVLGSAVELPVTNNIKTWGWVALVIGSLMIVVGLAVLAGVMWARIVAVAVLASNMVFQFAFLAHFPFWSFTMLLVDTLAIYGLVAHGGREVEQTEGYVARRVMDEPIDLTTSAPHLPQRVAGNAGASS